MLVDSIEACALVTIKTHFSEGVLSIDSRSIRHHFLNEHLKRELLIFSFRLLLSLLRLSTLPFRIRSFFTFRFLTFFEFRHKVNLFVVFRQNVLDLLWLYKDVVFSLISSR